LTDIDNTGGSYLDAPQLGTSILININDRRTQNAVWRSNSLFHPADTEIKIFEWIHPTEPGWVYFYGKSNINLIYGALNPKWSYLKVSLFDIKIDKIDNFG